MALLPLLELPPNRVRRNYLGGAMLDRLESQPDPQDTQRPEDWIASTTLATNPGLPPIQDEGLSFVHVPGATRLADLFNSAPDFYLGAGRTRLGFLSKLLDSAIRLHVQAHPTAAFAQQHLGSRWGKLEAYVILAVRPGVKPYIRLGFQRPPSPAEWRRIIMEQDIAAMDACFDPVPVQIGEVWLVPGGLPHAIGEGVLMLEVMEPTDLVVRCEFERAGIVVPPEARFMGRDPDLAMRIFDYTAMSVSDVQGRFRIEPQPLDFSRGVLTEQLIGSQHTDCFSIARITVERSAQLPPSDRIRLGIVSAGMGAICVEDRCVALRPGSRFLLAAAAPAAKLSVDGESLQILLCSPREI